MLAVHFGVLAARCLFDSLVGSFIILAQIVLRLCSPPVKWIGIKREDNSQRAQRDGYLFVGIDVVVLSVAVYLYLSQCLFVVLRAKRAHNVCLARQILACWLDGGEPPSHLSLGLHLKLKMKMRLTPKLELKLELDHELDKSMNLNLSWCPHK